MQDRFGNPRDKICANGWLRGEPRLEELLADPMVLLLAQRWRTTVDEIRQLAGRVEQSLH